MSNLSRRSFLKRLGVGSAAVVAAPLVASLPATSESTKPLVVTGSKSVAESTKFCPSSIAGAPITRMRQINTSGGFCASIDPYYDFSLVRDALPTIEAPRGEVEFR